MTQPRPPDIFIGLNILRVLSIIACLLVFSSSLVTMVDDVEAVNNLLATEKSNATLAASLLDCDYVAYVLPPILPLFGHTPILIHVFFLGTAQFRTKPLASFGPFSTGSSSFSRSSRSSSPRLGGLWRFSIGFFPCLVPNLAWAHWAPCNVCKSTTSVRPPPFAFLLLTRIKDSVRPYSRTTSTTLRSSLLFSYSRSVASTSCPVSSFENAPGPSEA